MCLDYWYKFIAMQFNCLRQNHTFELLAENLSVNLLTISISDDFYTDINYYEKSPILPSSLPILWYIPE